MRGSRYFQPFLIIGSLLLLLFFPITNIAQDAQDAQDIHDGQVTKQIQQPYDISSGITRSELSGGGALPIDTENYWYIDNLFKLSSTMEFLDGNIIINSTGSIIIEKDGELLLKDVHITFNSSGKQIPTIHVQNGGKLEIINLSTMVWYTSETKLPYLIIIESGSIFNVSDSYFEYMGDKSYQPGFRISSSKIEIVNCTFGNGFVGLSFENTSNTTIKKCKFLGGRYGVVLNNTENIHFKECYFSDNAKASFIVIDSGNYNPIKLINCTISKKNPQTFELKNSTLMTINSTFPFLHNIRKSVYLDIDSKLALVWYVNLLTVDKKNKSLGGVDFIITNQSEVEIFKGKTDENGRAKWLPLVEKTLTFKKELIHNPYKIISSKSKNDYKGSKYISSNSSNFDKYLLIELSKEEKDEETNWQDSILMMCICIMVIITVFILMLSINLYLARRKAGLNKYDGIIIEDRYSKGGGKADPVGTKEFITCSECGTQVTEDATFCPHCGDYFEGDEFRCPGCDYKLTEKDKSCPKCGRIFDEDQEDIEKVKTQTSQRKATRKKDEKLFCSECGGVVNANDLRCPGCDLEFSKRSADKKKTTIKDGKKLAFKVTGQEEKELDKNKAKDRKIKMDEGHLDRSRDEDNEYMCSICGATVKETTKKCPKCGTELE
jgi:parallel beta-helix repeat protein